ncbi:MAG TPA: zinc-ribbon domain-containing protein [Bacteroidales bacterium]|nr:zinc-ribbon domain-containing protein [Bacteroidales bacterium]
MKVCNYCGVELDEEMNFCPLCGHRSNVQVANENKVNRKEVRGDEQDAYSYEELTQRQKRKLVWELAAFILVLTSVVTFIVDLLSSGQVTWSKYTMTIGIVLLFDISLIILIEKRIYLILIGCFLSSSFLLFLLDFYTQSTIKGLTIGVPIIFFIFLIVFLLTIIIKKTKQKGINLIAYSLMAAGIICLCIEGIISLHVQHHLKFYWSLIVLISVLPVSAILLYIHYRLKRATNLNKFFHI